MVDQSSLPKSLKLVYSFYGIMTVRAGSNKKNKKYTRVLSTKLSIDDYDRFVIYSKTAHALGIIDEPTPSRFLRYSK